MEQNEQSGSEGNVETSEASLSVTLEEQQDDQNSINVILRNTKHANDNIEEFCVEKINPIVLRSPTKTNVRQRSLFTANSPPSPAEVNFSKFNVSASPFISTRSLLNPKEGSYRIPQQIAAPVLHAGTGGQPLPIDIRLFRSLSARHVPPQPMYRYDDHIRRVPSLPPNFFLPVPSSSNHRSSARDFDSASSYHVTPNGTILIKLREGIRINMTVDRAIRVINPLSHIAISLSANGASSALIHPNGRVFQYAAKVEIVAFDGMKQNKYVRYAKMWHKGISFTSENSALTYLVDDAGTRTTSDSFADMSKDYTLAIFYTGSRQGSDYTQEATQILEAAQCQCLEDGTDVLDINGFRISQTADGLLRIARQNNKYLIRTSPGNGSATLSTPGIHCTASLGKTSHLFVRRSERRMHFDGASFVVRNAGHSAGFDEKNLLNVY